MRFDPMLLTCAHRTQPLGSRLLVTSAASGRSVVVTVTDRGPYAGPDRIIDLSRAAASRIGMVQGGLNNVTIERINPNGAPAGNDVEVAQAPDDDDSAQAVRAAAKP
jgi:rare lipoprotein A